MQGSHFIRVYDGALPDELCDYALKVFADHQQRRVSWVGRVSGGYVPTIKCSEDTQFEKDDPRFAEFQANIVALRERYYADTGQADPVTGKWWPREPFIQHYPLGTGGFKEHTDINPHHYHRRWVYLAYLNTVEEGGETYFPLQGIKVRPIKGRVVAFPPTWVFPHGSNTPLTQSKTVLTTIHSIVDEAEDV